MDDINKGKAPVRDEKVKKAPTQPTSGMISFVAFDDSSSDASRRAIRKQAALASAAARKATIAKKVAKQREHERASLQNKSTETVSGKRKRTLEGPWQSGISVIPSQTVAEDAVQKQPRRSQPRIVTAYLSPPRGQDSLSGTTSGTSAASSELEVPYSYGRQIIPLKHSAWAVMSDDYEENQHSHLPPSPESLASPGTGSASPMDPFSQYPVPYHPVYDRLLHHMMTVFAPRGWASLKITNQEGLRWERFMTQHALAEPALFLVRVMFASGDMIRLGVLEHNVAVALRGLAINAINEALTDNERSISDGLILAVGRIAFAESLYGDKEAANTMHRPAQRRMIDLRGGMGALDFPPLIKRLMRMTDRIMSIQSGTPRLMPDGEESGHTSFDMKSTVNVMEDWQPQEARAIRRKIAIADLVT